VFDRVHDLAIGLLRCTDRSTVAGMITAAGRDQQDWSADYRVFSRGRFNPDEIFSVIVKRLLAFVPNGRDVVIAVDDTNLRKSGTKIPGVSYRRDPMSPAFRANLIRAQRFIQASMSIPLNPDTQEASRAFPIRFRHAPSVPRPPRNAPASDHQTYRRRCRDENLSTQCTDLLRDCRHELDRHDAAKIRIIGAVDGGYTNKTVLRNLPDRTILIGRVRSDAKLFHPPDQQPGRGRKRSYGILAPRPEQLRTDDSVPWQTVRVWASGAFHDCAIKSIGPVLSPMTGPDRPLRLIVIRPLGYRLSKRSRILYRKPAYLICTDPDMDIAQLVQSYFRRWDIEVNHRDEKQLIGVGQAQVRAPLSAERLPSFAVAVYSLMLVAAAETYGLDATEPPQQVPRWQVRGVQNQTRLTSGQILRATRSARAPLRASKDQLNFTGFEAHVARHLKCPKSQITPQSAFEYAMFPS
jgi:hypothetical protein